ncbi:hypothetical protein B0H15DRAFT_821972 [Mycena belliarum]|uniref:Uncharacterized protein n=1 Tax=Mycena belliarum TaxID=1033014 RepID=A0AAD6UDE1_9AGAR|nr:hypothetical protein B0H15DRAFT_821972 [Mycena belliae]
MPAQTTIIPQFPVEVLEQIISTTWHMMLSPSQRIVFMRSSALVNSTWADIFDLISSRDVYVPSAAFCDHLILQLRAQQPFAHAAPPSSPPSSPLWRVLLGFKKPSKMPSLKRRIVNATCRSITFQLANVDVHPDRHERLRLPMAAALDELLENLDARPLAPNLRSFTLEYLDVGFDDLPQRMSLDALPEQVKHLCVQYSYSPGMPAVLLLALQMKQQSERKAAWTSQTIREVTLIGAGPDAASDMSRACPNARVVAFSC